MILTFVALIFISIYLAINIIGLASLANRPWVVLLSFLVFVAYTWAVYYLAITYG